MSSTEARTNHASSNGKIEMHLEVDIIPVSDVDRAKQFYQGLGWRLDDDAAPANDIRIVQFTPPGSGCSVTFGKGITAAPPGSAEGGLTVTDIEAAHDDLVSLGIDASDVWHGAPFPGGGTVERPRPRAHELRVVLLLQRSRRQCVASSGGHHAASRPNLIRHSPSRQTWRSVWASPGGTAAEQAGTGWAERTRRCVSLGQARAGPWLQAPNSPSGIVVREKAPVARHAAGGHPG